MNPKKIALGCDHGGFKLKKKVAIFLHKAGYDVIDFGAFSKESMDYPDTAYKAALAVSKHKADKGILICKSGIGNSIVANKVKGVRAALCYNIKAAKLSRQHNDANVLVLGSSFIKEGGAKKIITAWFEASFEGGRHLRRIKKIERIEKKCG